MRALRRLFILGLIVLIAYIAQFIYFNPTHFIYADGPIKVYGGATNTYLGGPPTLDCTKRYEDLRYDPLADGVIYVKGCMVSNVPVGQENMYVRESNKFIYYTIIYPWVGPVILFVLFGLLFGRKFFDKVNAGITAEQKPQQPPVSEEIK